MQQEDESYLSRVVLCKNVLDCNEVFERLGHLLTVDVEVASVPEVVDPVVTVVISLALCQLIVVMREPQVNTPRVDVNWVGLEN